MSAILRMADASAHPKRDLLRGQAGPGVCGRRTANCVDRAAVTEVAGCARLVEYPARHQRCRPTSNFKVLATIAPKLASGAGMAAFAAPKELLQPGGAMTEAEIGATVALRRRRTGPVEHDLIDAITDEPPLKVSKPTAAWPRPWPRSTGPSSPARRSPRPCARSPCHTTGPSRPGALSEQIGLELWQGGP